MKSKKGLFLETCNLTWDEWRGLRKYFWLIPLAIPFPPLILSAAGRFGFDVLLILFLIVVLGTLGLSFYWRFPWKDRWPHRPYSELPESRKNLLKTILAGFSILMGLGLGLIIVLVFMA